MILTSCTPALDMLTFQLVSLSKPVGPIMGCKFLIYVIEFNPKHNKGL